MPPKRKVFISFFQPDRREVDKFIETWAVKENVFIPKVLGAGDNLDRIASQDPGYVMQQIRDSYIGDSTVTVVLIGDCTHSWRYVDWEIKGSLQRAKDSLPNGLLGILLPSRADGHLPHRFGLNWTTDEANCYARYRAAPSSAASLSEWIEDAFTARTSRAHLISNPSEMWKNNRNCEIHRVAH